MEVVMTILVAASGEPGSFAGPRSKYEAIAKALRSEGLEVELFIPDRGGWAGAKSVAARIREGEWDLVILRSGPAFLASWPTIAKRKRRGMQLSLEKPSPSSHGVREALGSNRGPLRKMAHISLTLVATPWLSMLADRVVVYAPDSKYFTYGLSRKTQLTTNAVDFSTLPLQSAPTTGPITMIAVASVSHWHGIDRVIAGMAASPLNANDSRLLVVGDGPALPSLVSMTRELGLESRVDFLGYRVGAELDHAFDGADLAVGCLGLHRKGMDYGSPLKHREYLARGLPVVFAGSDPLMTSAVQHGFAMEAPADDSPIDMTNIQTFVEQQRPRDPALIRHFAEAQVSAIRTALDYLPPAFAAASGFGHQ